LVICVAELPKEAPHRVIDKILDSFLEIPKNVSESISLALDKGPLGNKGPHRAIDAVVKSIASSVQSLGEGIASALDKPLETIKR